MSDEDKTIERLLRIADPGPELPAGGEARIRAAVRPIWRKEMRKRATRRIMLGGLVAAAVAAFVVSSFTLRVPVAPASPSVVARVELVRGPIDASLQAAQLTAGARLHTGSNSRAALRTINGVSWRLDSDTTVRLVSADLVELERGAIYIDSDGVRARPTEVRTPFGSVRDIGTQFELRLDDHLLVRVREGRVHVATSRHQFHLTAGMESQIASDGSQETAASAFDLEPWTATIAPPFPIEGRSVSALLDWCAKESGLALRYRDAHAERAAQSTLLHGVANDLRPLEAARTILPTAGLEAIPEGHELVVRIH